ncbi:MAG: aspartate-semialdehyde dehydrogenase [bacterium]|nr:aspartate-semialdehyde dehydrogenase [bacterium]MDE0600790.1 aspartate-semialdehyde dehydrogenase [bacterium]
MSIDLALVGATGAVGRTALDILAERDFPIGRLRLMASARSAGKKVSTAWGKVEVEDLDEADPGGVEVAIFSAGASRSEAHGPRFVEAGAVVIDNSSCFRMDPRVPLVVADVNDHALESHEGLIANPNCTTMVLMMAVAPLHRAAGLRSMVATSYQSVSGSGQKGMAELSDQIEQFRDDQPALAQGRWTDPGTEVYSRPIGFNVLPLAGSETRRGYTDEEWKLVNESRKILDLPGLAVEPTCVRVPVMVGHGLAASMWFDRPLDRSEAVRILSAAPGVEVWEDIPPTPLDSAGRDRTLVGRVRETVGAPGGINLWAVGDNLRKGAALNTIQLAERLKL